MKTFTPKPADLTHDWYVIDATDVVLGRLATQAATLLRGKNKPTYAPHADSGNHVIIINADKIALTGNKMGKELYSHSGRPGGLRRDSYAELLEKNPERIIKNAVKGMLPKNRLAKVQLDRLRIFRGAEHPHTPQKPQVFEIAQVSQALKDITACAKLNIAALGNMVPQLHVHIIARNPGDAAWPGVVFGAGTRQPMGDLERQSRLDALRGRLSVHSPALPVG